VCAGRKKLVSAPGPALKRGGGGGGGRGQDCSLLLGGRSGRLQLQTTFGHTKRSKPLPTVSEKTSGRAQNRKKCNKDKGEINVGQQLPSKKERSKRSWITQKGKKRGLFLKKRNWEDRGENRRKKRGQH